VKLRCWAGCGQQLSPPGSVSRPWQAPDGLLDLAHPTALENPPANGEALTGRARQRVEDLIGPVPAGGPEQNRRGEVGPCRVCGHPALLTFEHVPPRSAGNNVGRRIVDMPTDLAHPVGVFPPIGWIQAQRGVGAYATCENCNSFSGSEYVPSYTDFVASLLNALQEWAETIPDDEPPKTLSFTMSRGRPGDVVRQAPFMILATSGSPGLGVRYPVLRDVVLNKATATLPAEMTLRLSLVITPRSRMIGVMMTFRLSLVITPRSRMIGVTGEANFDTDSERALVEVAFSPLAWLLEVGDPSARTSAVVSTWTDIPAGAEEDFSLRTTLGTITTGAVALGTSKQTPRYGGAVQMATASSVKLASSRRRGSLLKPSS
jgi:hypothetical protein